MAHGYYNLQGTFVTTSTQADATNAWRAERGYSTGGVYDMGGGNIIDAREESPRPATPAPAAPAPESPAAPVVDPNQELADILAARYPTQAPTQPRAPGQSLDQRLYNLPQFDVSPEYTHEAARLSQLDTGYIHEDARLGQVDRGEPTPSGSIWDRATGALSRGIESNLESIGLGSILEGEYHSPWDVTPAKQEPQVVESQYTGRQYYQGGSERAYLGPVAQAEEWFLGTGDRWGLGSSYIDIAPEDRKPPPILNQSTVRILTKGTGVTMEDIERIYEFDPATGHYLLKGGEPDGGYPSGDYYTSSGQGYASAGPGYGQGYGYGSRGGQVGGGLINWRIGF